MTTQFKNTQANTQVTHQIDRRTFNVVCGKLLRRVFSQSAPVVASIFLVFACYSSHAELQLNGYSVYSKLKTDYFFASLYLEEASDKSIDVFDNKKSRRIEMRIMEKYSPRKFKDLWLNGITINNNNASVEESFDSIQLLTNGIQGDLEHGDRIDISYSPQSGTSLTVNGIKVGEVMNYAVFNLLLKAWIGDVPLSTFIKNDLISGGAPLLLDTYLALSPTSDRKQIALSWEKKAIAKKLAEKAQEHPKPSIVAIAPPEIKQTTPKLVLKKKPKVAPKATVAKINMPLKVKTVIIPEVPAIVAIKKATVKTKQSPISPAMLAEINKSVDIARNKKNRTTYLPKLHKWIENKVSFPLAVTNEPSSKSVTFDVIIDRRGLVTNILRQGRRSRSFNYKEALEIIKNASPFPEIPTGISGDSFEFNLHFVQQSRGRNMFSPLS